MSTTTEIEKLTAGRILSLNKKGFGFISSKEVPFTKIFFHWTSLLLTTKKFNELQKGDYVEFVLNPNTPKGIQAIKVRVVDKPKDE